MRKIIGKGSPSEVRSKAIESIQVEWKFQYFKCGSLMTMMNTRKDTDILENIWGERGGGRWGG